MKYILRKGLGMLALAALLGGLVSGVPAVYADPKADKKEVHADAKPAQPVNINKATAEELQELKGVGPAMAERIIQYRQEHGGFQKAEDLMGIRGIGQAKYEKMKNQVTL